MYSVEVLKRLAVPASAIRVLPDHDVNTADEVRTIARALRAEGATSGQSLLNQYRLPERGARIARREERVCWAQMSDEQRREAGCPARQVVVIRRGQATSDGQQEPTETVRP